MKVQEMLLNKDTLEKSWALLSDLYAVSERTLMGLGYERSLDLIAKDLPLKYLKVPTGTKLGSWTVPSEWSVNEAWIRRADGTTLCDYAENPLHLWHYSTPFKGKVSGQELRTRLASVPACAHAIPHVVTYYKERWGFSLPHSLVETIDDGHYEVCVDSSFRPGNLLIGEYFIPGKSKETILIDAVLSSPALANNTTGPALAAGLAWQLSQLDDLKYSYRVVFTPETIGPVACHYALPHILSEVIGGVTLSNLGDPKDFFYRSSRPGDTVADRAMQHALSSEYGHATLEAFDVRTGTAGNEKAWNSLGIEAPVGALRRSPFSSYPEYDTSADDMSFVKFEHFHESFQLLITWISALEMNETPKHTFIGEPFLTGYGLFSKIVDERQRHAYDYLMAFCDGREDLLSISERAGLPLRHLYPAYEDLLHAGLLAIPEH